MASPLFDSADIRQLLVELAEDLHKRGVTARIFVSGGAAMALAYYDREGTGDVDAVFAPADEVIDAAGRIAARHGLPEMWLNSAASMYLPPSVGLDAGRPTIEAGGVEIAIADPELLLAMKLRASRGRRDLADIAVLIRSIGVPSADAAVRIYDEFYPEEPMPARASAALSQAFGPLGVATTGESLHLDAAVPDERG